MHFCFFVQVISKGNILFKNAILEDFKSSFEYTPPIKGQLLQPSISERDEDTESVDKTEFFNIYSPQGPPGWSVQNSPGAPGYRGPPAPMNPDGLRNTGTENGNTCFICSLCLQLQWTLVISTLLISNNRLSQSENLVPVSMWKSNNS